MEWQTYFFNVKEIGFHTLNGYLLVVFNEFAKLHYDLKQHCVIVLH